MDQSDKMPIAKRYRALLDSGEFSDCRFIVKNDGEDKEFPAHKLILSITSSVFDCMFRKCYVESKGVIIIDDIDPDTFYQLLVYIYSSEVNMKTIDDAVKLCNAANKYMLFNLTDICFKFVLGKVASSNISMVYSFAMLHERAEIFKRLWQVIDESSGVVMQTKELQNVEESFLLNILKNVTFHKMSSIMIYNSVRNWIKNKNPELVGQNLHTYSKPFMECIKFLEMDSVEFSNGPAIDGLLSNKDALDTLIRIIKKPSGTCYNSGYRYSSTRICNLGYSH